MSDTSEVDSAARRADQALGSRRASVIEAVEAARASVGSKTSAPTPDERRDLKAVDRPKLGEAADKAMGKDRDQAVAVVDAAAEALSADGPPADDAPPTDTVPAPPPDDGGREGRLLSDIRARERRLEDGRARFRREREEFENYKQRVERELAEARESMALAQRDPFAWFERYHGIKRSAFGVGGGQDPQASVAREQESARIRQLEDSLNRMRAAEAEREQRAARERELDKFASEARADVKRWPLASKYDIAKLKSRGWELAFASARGGATLSNDEVLDRIEEELSEIASLRAPKPPAPSAPKPAETPGSEAKSSHQPTLSGRSVSDSAPSPRSPLKMKRSEMISETVRVLEDLRKKRD